MTTGEKLSEISAVTAVELFGTKWKVLIVRSLLKGTQRFKHLLYGIEGISAKVLTENLRMLEEDGLIKREVYPEIPLRVEYSLTPLGEKLRPLIEALTKYGGEYKRSMRNKKKI